METITCTLPGGYVDGDGSLHRQAEIASLSGREEELLAVENRPNSASMVTSILSQCVHRIGGISPVDESMIRKLLVADRQYLLLKSREISFGDRVQVTIVCTNQECAERIDIDFSVRDVPVTESEDKGPLFRMELSESAAYAAPGGELLRLVTFRLPNGEDQEAVLPVLEFDEVGASELLLARCIQNVGSDGRAERVETERLSPLARMEIEQAMEAAAPRVELTMEGDCPECGREFSVPLDLERFFFNEFRTSLDLIYQEVHYLAYHYHWSEREIMEMPKQKRRRYIQVLADEIERLNDAVQYSY